MATAGKPFRFASATSAAGDRVELAQKRQKLMLIFFHTRQVAKAPESEHLFTK
jgi:hypothetical protein